MSIATLTGENGIQNQAINTQKESDIAEVKEQAKLDITSWTAERLQNGESTTLDDSTVKSIIENANKDNTNKYYSELTDTSIITKKENEILYSELYDKKEEVKGVEYTELKVGDYVSNYPVYYDNVESYNVSTLTSKDEYNGWRILSVDTTNKIVRLVSAGVPLNYKQGSSNASKSVENLTTKFFSTPITSTAKTDYNFYSCGFKIAKDGTKITNIDDVKKLFYNDYTEVYGENEKYTDSGNTYTYTKGNPKVQSMTKSDLDTIYGSATSSGTYVGKNDILAIPCKNSNSNYAAAWLASAYSSKLWGVGSTGYIGYAGNYTNVIRVVVTLKADVKFTQSEEKINNTQAWDIAI